MSDRRKGFGRPAMIAAIIIAVVLFFVLKAAMTPKVGPMSGEESARDPYTGPTAPVELAEIPITVEAVGTVRPVAEAVITSRVMGVIERMEVDAGDRVQRGELLVVLSTPELASRSTASSGAVAAAEASLRQAERDFERMNYLHSREAATEVEYERAATAVEVARSNLRSARGNSGAAGSMASYSRIRAPFAGIVLERNMDRGDLASPGAPILRIGDDRLFRLEVSVPEGRWGSVETGDTVLVVVDAIGLETEAVVSEIIPSSDPVSRTFTVKADLPADEPLRDGLFGRMRVVVGSRPGLVIPSSAVIRVGGLETARVVDADGNLRTIYLRLGEELGNGLIEVAAGLEEGEEVAAAFRPTNDPEPMEGADERRE